MSKTTFRTKFGHYEVLVRPFGLTNVIVVFMALMNGLFAPYLDKFIVVFIDDVLVYSRSKKECKQHLRAELQLLREDHLYANFKRTDFYQKQVNFLEHVISIDSLMVDPVKIEAVVNWWIHSFLVLLGYYKRFVERFSIIADPLTKLTWKNTHFVW